MVKVLGSENTIAEAAGGKLPPLNRLKVLENIAELEDMNRYQNTIPHRNKQ